MHQIRYFAGARQDQPLRRPWDALPDARCMGAPGRQRRMSDVRSAGLPGVLARLGTPGPTRPSVGPPCARPDVALAAAAPLVGGFALRARTLKSRFHRCGSLNIRFAPKATELLHHSELSQRAQEAKCRPFSKSPLSTPISEMERRRVPSAI
jgi:hypothetical protein